MVCRTERLEEWSKHSKNLVKVKRVTKHPSTLIIVPAYNEEKNLAKTVSEVREKAPWADILVVNDGSDDKTLETAERLNVFVASLPFNLRIGGAVQTGFQISRMRGYDVTLQVDADGQHDPAFIEALIEPVTSGKTDISIGSRYLENNSVSSSFTRHLGVRFFSWVTTRAVGKRVTDCTSGFRALNKKAVDFFASQYPIDFPDAEALILAHRAGLEITEIPVKFRNRAQGRSSLYFWRLLYYPIKEMFSIIMLLTERRR